MNPFHPVLPDKNNRIIWDNLPKGSLSLSLSSAITASQKTLVIITPDTLSAERLQAELAFFNHHTIIYFPDWETLPFDYFSPHQDIISERLAALYQIPNMQNGTIITTVSTLMHRLPPQRTSACS